MVVLDPEHAPDVLSDADLVADAQRGSTEAFAALYQRHHPRILGHCRNRIGGNDAADAAQETFLRAWGALDGFGGDGRVYPWLRTIATNVCIDTLRRRSRTVPVAEVEPASIEERSELGLLAAHTDAMTEALARLSARHRSVLQLREYEGWSYERIAAHEQLDLSAVKSVLWRARQSLRREFLLVSAHGRLSAVAGLFSLARLRHALADLGASGAQLGASGGAVAATGATAVAAVAVAVAVPTFVAPPPPSPPVVPAAVVVTTTIPPTSPVVVRRRSTGAVVHVAAPSPATSMPSTTTTTVAPTRGTDEGPSASTRTVPAEGDRASDRGQRDERKAEAADEKVAAKVEHAIAKAEEKAAKAHDKSARVEGRRAATSETSTSTSSTVVTTTTSVPAPDDAERDRRGRGRHRDGDRT